MTSPIPRATTLAAFKRPADFTLGTTRRNILPTPPLRYVDIASQLSFKLLW